MQCSSCGTTLQPGMTKCPSCGAPVSTDTSDSPYEEHAGAVPYIPYTPLKEREAAPASSATPAAPTAPEGSRSSDLLAGAQPQQAAPPAGSGPLAQAPGAAQPFPAQQWTPVQPAVAQQPPQRQGLSPMAITLSVILALLIIVGAGGLIYYATGPYPAEQHAQATAVVQNVLAQQQQANAQATANIAALIPQKLYTQVTSGKPAISDPLDSINHSLFVSLSNPSSSCGFTGGAYHASASAGFIGPCLAPAVSVSNFAFQAQMTIIKGNAGGLIFRLNFGASSLNSYLFLIDHLGGYRLVAFQNNNTIMQLANGVSSAVNVGLNQSNLLTVIARGNNFYLYVNKQYITSARDNTFSSGVVGVFASGANATDVVFSNAQVWKL
jgi:hypothetical protein